MNREQRHYSKFARRPGRPGRPGRRRASPRGRQGEFCYTVDGMKVALFDLDGTLIRAGGAGRRALDRAILKLHGHPEVCKAFSLSGRTDRQNFRLAHRNATGRKPTAGDLLRIQSAYLRLLPGEVRKALREGRYARAPGISKLLRRLSGRRDVLLGLGTGNIIEGASIKLRPSGLRRYFTFGGYGGDGYTRVQMLRTAVRRAQKLCESPILPRDVYVIGDTPMDVAAGKRAGFHTGVVTCGYADAAALRKASPELMEPDFRDVRTWTNWLLGKTSSLKKSVAGLLPTSA